MPERPKLLLFLEGTILDDRAILYLKVTKHESGYTRRLGESAPVEGAVEFAKKMAGRFDLVYLGDRADAKETYQAWLEKHAFPAGELLAGGNKARLPKGISFAIDDRVQDGDEHYGKQGIRFIPVNQYVAKWEKVVKKLEVGIE
jgi:hypothetical protein